MAELFNGTLRITVNHDFVKPFLDKYIAFVPENSVLSKNKRDGKDKYHITIASPSETKELHDSEYNEIDTKFHILGLGTTNGAYYLVVHYPSADKYRSKMNLKPYDFHITLGFNICDVHDVDKGISTLIKYEDNIHDLLVKNKTVKNKMLKLYEDLKNLGNYDLNMIFELSKLYGAFGKYTKALETVSLIRDNDVIKYHYVYASIKDHQNLITFDYVKSICDDLTDKKFKYSEELNKLLEIINKHYDKRMLYYDNKKNEILTSKLPMNFSNVDDKVSGSGIVSNDSINAILNIGFTDIITLTETPLGFDKDTYPTIKFHHFPIIDRKWTTTNGVNDIVVMNNILSVIESSDKVLVHCLGGVGRTNTVLAAYLMKTNCFSPSEAITVLERQRNVKLAGEQIMFLKKYYGVLNTLSSETPSISLPKLIMLVGLPCSGKTTLSNDFIRKYQSKIVHINQDDLGKQDCIEFFNDNIKNDKTIVLDRCNLTKKDRKEWVDMMTSGSCTVIYYNVGLAICKERLVNRELHPTFSGASKIKILEELSEKIEVPTLDEGFKEILTVDDDTSLLAVYKKFGLSKRRSPLELIKFPRTKHLINLGSASRDDLIMDNKDVEKFLSDDIYIHEKIDGANLGIFRINHKIYCQNRSHFVSSVSHEQFKYLDSWIEEHKGDLFNILKSDRYILYGEWLCAKHSIHYVNLPDYFLAFDIYDTYTESFLSCDLVNNILSKTTIKSAKLLAKGKYGKDYLVKLATTTKSEYYDGLVEGVYIKTCKDGKTTGRAKIVRPDFICGTEHWTKNETIWNTKKY